MAGSPLDMKAGSPAVSENGACRLGLFCGSQAKP